MGNPVIAGYGKALPVTELSNDAVVAKIIASGGNVGTNAQWIEDRTFIRSRRVAISELCETTATLAAKAARQALARANMNIGDVDEIIVATVTPDHGGVPGTASLVHEMLNGGKRSVHEIIRTELDWIPASDINAGCSGFLFALRQAYYSVLYEGLTVLVIGADCLQRLVNWEDRSTAPLFGDGAGALILAPGERGDRGLRPVIVSGCGNFDTLHVSEQGYLTMAGKEVFEFAVKAGVAMIADIMARDHLSGHDIAWVFLHQANGRITRQIWLMLARRLNGIPEGKMRFWANIDRYGNTSAASIPLSVAEAAEQGFLKEGDHILMVAFGAGLTCAAAHVVWGRS